MSNQLQTAEKKSLLSTMASKYDMDPEAFKNTIKATVMPPNSTNEQMAAFLLVANHYDLNPITREIYAFPSRGGGVTPVVGIDGWITLAQRHPEFDGMDFEYSEDSEGRLRSCACYVYRKDRSRPVAVTEYMDECRRPTDPWKTLPRRMLRHKAAIQGIRYAFGFSGIKDEDDACDIASAPAHEKNITPNEKRSDNRTTTGNGVEDVRRKIEAAQQRSANEREESDAAPPEWPKDMGDGVLVASNGAPWIADVHSAGKTCSSDGTWRKKKGVSPITVELAEQEAIEARPIEFLKFSRPNFSHEDFMRIIREAKTKEALDEIEDMSRERPAGMESGMVLKALKAKKQELSGESDQTIPWDE